MRVKLQSINRLLLTIGLVLVVTYPDDPKELDKYTLELMRYSKYMDRVVSQKKGMKGTAL